MDNKGKRKRVIIIIGVIIIFIATNITSFIAGGMVSFSSAMPWVTSSEFSKQYGEIEDIQKYEKLFGIRELLYKRFDGDIDDNKLLEGAIKGMASSLGDKYTYYMNSEEYKKYIEDVSGNFYGIGVTIQAKDGKIYIVNVIKGSPAEKAGLKAGDYILKVAGKEYNDKTLNDVSKALRGEKGKTVTVTILRGNDTIDFDVERGEITHPSVEGEMIDDQIGYISVSGFELKTATDFENKLKELKDKGMKGLIMDLRDNGGGYLNVAVDLASNFIEKDKVVVSTINKYDHKDESLSKGGIAIGMPLVVLVNGNSASASEVVSGALRDYNAATLVGTKTFGKGIVQTTIEDKNDGSALKVTISKYYSPNGININHKGIEPDVLVEYPQELLGKEYDRSKDPQFSKALEEIKGKIK